MLQGFGDVVPVTDAGRIFTIFFVLFGCSFLAKVVSEIIKVWCPIMVSKKCLYLMIMVSN